MNTYYLRCRQDRYSTMVDRGARMGVITIGDVVTATEGGCWDYVGVKILPDGSVSGGEQNPFVHVNLRTPIDLRLRALELAASGDADIANGLAEIAEYFIVDENGRAAVPEFPMRVFL